MCGWSSDKDNLSNDAPGAAERRDSGGAPGPAEARQVSELRAQAVRCRRLAASIGDQKARAALEQMAREYDVKAGMLSRA